MSKTGDAVALEILKGSLPDDLDELRELRIEVPLAKWNLLVKNVHSDRKLLGGLLLDFAKHKDRVSAAVGSERLLVELQRVLLDATAALIEEGVLVLTLAAEGGE
jgi:hypothetical protein